MIRRAIDKTGETVRAVARDWDAYAETLDKIGGAAQTLGRPVMAAGLVLAAAVGGVTLAAVSWESSMADVAKVTGLAGGEFDAMSDKLRGLTRVLPLTHSEIAEIAAAGGTMGVPNDQLISYTQTVGKFSVAWDMAAGDVGEAAGKIAVAYGIAFNNLEPFGDTINYLADKVGGEANQLVDFVARLGGTAPTLHMATNEVAAFAATMIGAGAIPERAATSFETMISRLADVTGLSKPAQEAFGRLNIDAQRFQHSMAVDPTATVIGFLNKLKAAGENALPIANAVLGMDAGPAALLLVNNVDRLTGALAALEAQKQLNSVNEEFARRMETVAAQTILLKTAVMNVAITLGDVFLPMVARGIAQVKPFVDRVDAWAKANPDLTRTLGLLTAGVAGMLTVVGGGLFIFGTMAQKVGESMKAVKELRTAWAALRATQAAAAATTAASATSMEGLAAAASGGLIAGLRGAATASWAFTASLLANPLTWIAIAIGVAAFAIWKYWVPIKAFFWGLWLGIKEGMRPLMPAFAALGQAFQPLLAALRPVGAAFATAWDAVKSFFSTFFKQSDPSTSSILKIADAGRLVGRVVGGAIVGTVRAFVAFGRAVGTAYSAVVRWSGTAWDAVSGGAARAFAAVRASLAPFVASFRAVFAPVGAAFTEALGGVRAGAAEVAAAFAPIGAALAAAGRWALVFGKAALGGIVDGLARVWAWLEPVRAGIAAAFGFALRVAQAYGRVVVSVFQLAGRVAMWFAGVVGSVASAIGGVLMTALRFVGGVLGGIGRALQFVGGLLLGVFVAGPVLVLTGILHALSAVLTGVAAGLRLVASVGVAAWTAIGAGLGALVAVVGGAWRRIQSGASAAWSSILSAVTSMMERAKTAVLSIDLFAAGARLLQRFAAGIRSAAGSVTQAVRDAFTGAERSVPQSPVKEGPLRAFNQGGRKLMQLFASTVTPAPLTAALGRAFDQAERAVPRGVGLSQRAIARGVPAGIRLPEPGRARSGGAGMGPMNVTVNVNVTGATSPAAAAAEFGSEFEREVRRVLERIGDQSARIDFD